MIISEFFTRLFVVSKSKQKQQLLMIKVQFHWSVISFYRFLNRLVKIKHMMGRPISNRKSEPNTEDKRKSSFFRDKKKDRRNVYKSEFQKQIGNSKTGCRFFSKILKFDFLYI